MYADDINIIPSLGTHILYKLVFKAFTSFCAGEGGGGMSQFGLAVRH